MGQNISMEFIIDIMFYCSAIIIPTVFLLFTIGNLVFTIGEYKESDKSIPLILMLLSIKLFVITFSLFFMYHTIFDINFFVRPTVTTVTLLFWGLLIICDTCISNKMMGLLNRYILSNNNSNFGTYLKRGISTIYRKVPYCFYGNILFTSVLIMCTLMGIIIHPVNETIIILDCLLCIYLWISYKITKYFKKI